MLEFTSTSGVSIELDPALVIRIRRALTSEDRDANCRIDWGIMYLVTESVEDVVAAVRPELPSLVALTGGADTTIWVDARKVAGPFPPVPSRERYGYRSSIKLLGYRQYLRESMDETRAILAAGRAAGA